MDKLKSADEFSTQEIQEIIDAQDAQGFSEKTLEANTNQLTEGESKLVKKLESYIITFELKSIRGQNVQLIF